MAKYTLNQIVAICALVTLFACSEGRVVQGENLVEESVSEENEVQTRKSSLVKQDQLSVYTPPDESNEKVSYLDSLELKQIDSLRNIYSEVAAYSRIGRDVFYYVVRGELSLPEHAADFPFTEGDYKVGLVSSVGENLLPAKFDLIGSIGALAPNCVEVYQDDKVGLYNIKSGTYLSPKYDYLIPSQDSKFIAYGRTGNTLESINSNMSTQLVDKAQADRVERYAVQDWKVSTSDLDGEVMISPRVEYNLDDANECPYFYIFPKYWQLSINRINIANLCISDEKMYAFGTEELEAEVQEQLTFWDNIKINLVKLYELIGDGRGYTNDQLFLVNHKNKNTDTNFAIIEFPDGESYAECACDLTTERSIIQDSLFQFKGIGSDYEYGLYCGTKYSYVYIKPSGDIEQLNSNRNFSFTKWIKINSTYFEGCYFKGYDKDNREVVFNKLNAYDLDIMRNEIFADYGYKFKSEEWNEFFSQFKWYKPTLDNVDSLLTDIDKHNIEVILTAKNSMVNEKAEPKAIERVSY